MTARQIVDLEKLAEAQKEAAVRVSADPDAKPVRLTEQRITTTLRIEAGPAAGAEICRAGGRQEGQ